VTKQLSCVKAFSYCRAAKQDICKSLYLDRGSLENNPTEKKMNKKRCVDSLETFE